MNHPDPPFLIEIFECKGLSSISKGRLVELSDGLEKPKRGGEREVTTAHFSEHTLDTGSWTISDERFSSGVVPVTKLCGPLSTSKIAVRDCADAVGKRMPNVSWKKRWTNDSGASNKRQLSQEHISNRRSTGTGHEDSTQPVVRLCNPIHCRPSRICAPPTSSNGRSSECSEVRERLRLGVPTPTELRHSNADGPR
jgi:hypothetical protein